MENELEVEEEVKLKARKPTGKYCNNLVKK